MSGTLYSLLAKLGRALEMAEARIMMRRGLLPYQPDPFGFISTARTDRDPEATARKWALIEPRLPRAPYSALDVGCNIGYFAFKMAQGNADHVIGMDIERGPLVIAEKLKILSRVDNVGFLKLSVNPENIALLAEYDVILFLSVFHHLVYQYGMEPAKHVLSQLIRRTRKSLFFETGQGDQSFGLMASAMPRIDSADARDYFETLLRDCGASNVELIGETNVKDGATRLLFLVSPA